MPEEVMRRRRARSAERLAALSNRGAGLRAPTPGAREHVEVERLAGVDSPPRELTREDQFEAGLAALIGRRRVQTTQ